ncbi:MAG: PGDYG domain-containing protein [Candidatus Pacebacteria bacterium]|nr:PGDYG domain-containing protein [Candidatus Paceibacterota bacterium]
MEREPIIDSRIDRKSPEIIKSLSEAPIYKKQGFVEARKAEIGEEIFTILEDGTKETVNKANDGDWIVTNPAGEQYIVSGPKFKERYSATEEDNKYEAKGYVRAINNPFNKPIEIMASWGEAQVGDENCLIVDTCDENGKCGGEPYIIAKSAFEATYKKYE